MSLIGDVIYFSTKKFVLRELFRVGLQRVPVLIEIFDQSEV